ncbi:MAG: hypothetical protein RR209_05195 [Angelakisella sp.]
MVDFRLEHKLIEELINNAQKNDSNWSFTIGVVFEHQIYIEWGYLNYLGEPHNCFIIRYEEEIETLATYTPHDELIDIADTLEEAMLQIEHYAHSRY